MSNGSSFPSTRRDTFISDTTFDWYDLAWEVRVRELPTNLGGGAPGATGPNPLYTGRDSVICQTPSDATNPCGPTPSVLVGVAVYFQCYRQVCLTR